jgi:hypothetical protein
MKRLIQYINKFYQKLTTGRLANLERERVIPKNKKDKMPYYVKKAMVRDIRMEMNRNPEFKEKVEKVLQENKPKFLTQAHEENYVKARKQIAEWQASPPTLEEALKKQRERERQAKSYENDLQQENPSKFLTEAHKENYIKGKKQIEEWKKTPTPLSKILEMQRKRERKDD